MPPLPKLLSHILTFPQASPVFLSNLGDLGVSKTCFRAKPRQEHGAQTQPAKAATLNSNSPAPGPITFRLRLLGIYPVLADSEKEI